MNDNEILLRDSGYFDEAWYLAVNPDVKERPIKHYLLYGEKEGRKPSARFCPTYYLNRYQDVHQAGISPLLHYLTHGKKEKRQPRNPNQQFLVHAYLCKNLGDDLFVDILLDRYKDEAIDFYLNGKRNDISYFLKKYANCHAYQSEPDYNFDGIIRIGGSIFRELPGKLAMHRNFFETLQKFQIPTFILGCNFGPFYTAQFLKAFHEFFKNCRSVTVRDIKSKSYFEDIPTVKYVPDIVFGYPVSTLDKEPNTIGISIMDFNYSSPYRGNMPTYADAYETKMTELIAHYQKNGYKVRLFSFCAFQGDLKACQRIAKDTEIINYTGNLEVFLAKFQTCERIIANRFHSLILAQLYGIPFFPLIYNEKSANQLADVGLLEHACSIENISNLEVESLQFVTVNPQVLAPMLEASPQHFQVLDDYLTP